MCWQRSGYPGNYPLPPVIFGIIGLRRKLNLIYGLQQDAGKILERKELVRSIPDSARSYCTPEPVLAEMKFSVKVAVNIGEKKLWKKA
jgi:hypothetical protein